MAREPEPMGGVDVGGPALAFAILFGVCLTLGAFFSIATYHNEPKPTLIIIGNPDHPECSVTVDSRTIADLAAIGIYDWADACEQLREIGQ